MNTFYRAIISLMTLFPLSITFTYLYPSWLIHILPMDYFPFDMLGLSSKLFLTAIVGFLNLALGHVVVIVLRFIASRLDSYPVKVSTEKELGTDSLLAFLPYVFPLFIDPGAHQELQGWLLGCLMLLVLSLTTNTIAFSPLLRICGLRFFEVELKGGKVVTLLLDKPSLRPLSLNVASTISDNCIYGLK